MSKKDLRKYDGHVITAPEYDLLKTGEIHTAFYINMSARQTKLWEDDHDIANHLVSSLGPVMGDIFYDRGI
jgi:hypothetical protein